MSDPIEETINLGVALHNERERRVSEVTFPPTWQRWWRKPSPTVSTGTARFFGFKRAGKLLVHGGLTYQRQIALTVTWGDRRLVGFIVGRSIL